MRQIILFIFGFAALANVNGLTSPWAVGVERTTPWGYRESVPSSTRKENREAFFRGLQSKSTVENFAHESLEAGESVSSITTLPWKDYDRNIQLQSFSSQMLWPVEGGRLSSGYGIRNGRFHEGLDIRAPSASPIRAAVSGKVVFSGWLNGYGLTIVLYHGEGMATVFAHNSKNLRRVGDFVQRGQPIALVGTSGEATGAHVHFEIRQNGRPVNPLQFKFSESPLMAKIESSKDF